AGAILGGEWWMTAAVATCLALAAFAYSPRPHHAAVFLAAVLLAGAGHARIIELDTAPPPPLAALEGEHEVIGVVSGDPSRRGQFTRPDLVVETVVGNIWAGRLPIPLPSPLEPFERRDRLRLVGVVEPPPALEDFDYAAYLRARDNHAVIAFPREVE